MSGKNKQKQKQSQTQVMRQEQVHQEVQQQVMQNAEPVQAPVQENNPVEVQDIMHTRLSNYEVVVANDVLEDMRQESLKEEKEGFVYIDKKEEVIAKMQEDMSTGAYEILSKIPKKYLVYERKEARKDYAKQDALKKEAIEQEIAVYAKQNGAFTPEIADLQKKIKELEVRKKTLSKEEDKKLQKLYAEHDSIAKHAAKNETVLKRKEGMRDLQDSSVKLRSVIAKFRDKLEEEDDKSNSPLMQNVIKQVRAFEDRLLDPRFDIARQHDYMAQFIEMRNAIAKYHDKNKGTKFSRKGRRRRNLTKNFLDSLTDWIGDLPDEIQDTFVAAMEKQENEEVRNMESTDKMYTELCRRAFQKEADSDPEAFDDYRDATPYASALSFRFLATTRMKQRYFNWNQEHDVDPVELQTMEKKRNDIAQDPRLWGILFGSIEKNYDGSAVDPEQEARLHKAVRSWRENDFDALGPYLDDVIKQVSEMKLDFSDFLPENLKKNGPELIHKVDLILSIQNLFENQTAIGTKYLERLAPGVKTRIQLLGYYLTMFSSIVFLASDLNVSYNREGVNKISVPKEGNWYENYNIESLEEPIRYLMQFQQGGKFNDKLFEGDGDFLSMLSTLFKDNYIKKEQNYFSKSNKTYRRYAYTLDMMQRLPEYSEKDEEIYAIYEKLIAFEDRISKKPDLEPDAEEQKEYDLLKYQLEMAYKKKEARKEEEYKTNYKTAAYYKYEGRDPELEAQFRQKAMAIKADYPKTAGSSPELAMTAIHIADTEKLLKDETVPEDKKAAYRKLLNNYKKLQLAQENAYLDREVFVEEMGNVNSMISEIRSQEMRQYHEIRTKFADMKEMKNVVSNLIPSTESAIQSYRKELQLKKETTLLTYKEVYHLKAVKNSSGENLEPNVAEQVLNLVADFEYETSLLKRLYSLQDAILDKKKKWSHPIVKVDLTAQATYIANAIESQKQAIVNLEHSAVQLLQNQYDIEGVSTSDYAELLKNCIILEDETGEKTVSALEKEEFVNKTAFATAIVNDFDMTKEGAGLSYAYKKYVGTADSLHNKYIPQGSADETKLRNKYQSEDINRVFECGLKQVRFDENMKAYKEDAQAHEWNKKWAAACVSDNYEDKEPLLEDIIDEIITEHADFSEKWLDPEFVMSDLKHMAKFQRLCHLTLAFEGNILKHKDFSRFKEEYPARSEENEKKFEKMTQILSVWRMLTLHTLDNVNQQYALNEDFVRAKKFMTEKGYKDTQNTHTLTLNSALYGYGMYVSGEEVHPLLNMQEMKSRLEEIPGFTMEKMEEYKEFFKICAKIDASENDEQKASFIKQKDEWVKAHK